jgi:deoxyribodipyrimidine photo-lyase
MFPGRITSSIAEFVAVDSGSGCFVNRDYTPFSLERDQNMANICQGLGVGFFSFADALLTEPEQVTKDDGLPYTVFTPFMKKARKIHIPVPVENTFNNYYNGQ